MILNLTPPITNVIHMTCLVSNSYTVSSQRRANRIVLIGTSDQMELLCFAAPRLLLVVLKLSISIQRFNYYLIKISTPDRYKQLHCLKKRKKLHFPTSTISDLGQVMNNVQKKRRLSRQGSNPTLTKNRAKLQAAAKAAMIDDSYGKQKLSRFQSFKFTIRTFHFVLTVSEFEPPIIMI
jgi:hypothetical protein